LTFCSKRFETALLTAKQDEAVVRFIFKEALKQRTNNLWMTFAASILPRVRQLTSDVHDRFIIVDSTSAYSAGHSLKDLGSKDTVLTLSPDPTGLVQIFEQRWAAAIDWAVIFLLSQLLIILSYFYTLNASWWLTRIVPVAPHFGQTPSQRMTSAYFLSPIILAVIGQGGNGNHG
jgi:hypothetical protein